MKMMSSYLTATKPTPLLNTPNFKNVFGSTTLSLDEKGLLRAVEMVALPGTKFKMIRQIDAHILEVTTKDYMEKTVYLDNRFVKEVDPQFPEREKNIPPFKEILAKLNLSIGLPYIWGGNWGKGIPEISSLYQPFIPPSFLAHWTLAGVDCSGLLYEATGGSTPRNTSELLHFGQEIFSMEEIKPLDLLVWPGHVLIVLNSNCSIESRYGEGVIIKNLKDRINSISSIKYKIRRFLIK